MNGRKNYLGIDYGSSKVGIALGHAETGVALAYSTLKNDEFFLPNLKNIIELEGIGTVIIGIPARNTLPASSVKRSFSGWRSNVGGPSHVNREEVEYDGEKLGKLILEKLPNIHIAYQDEMFTTKMAQANLIERGEKHVGKHDDAEAARIILQSYMDRVADIGE
jgi:RNase H-fold protein (predicted Holliday junction resolvase)